MLKKIAEQRLPKKIKIYIARIKGLLIGLLRNYRIVLYSKISSGSFKIFIQCIMNEDSKRIIWLDQFKHEKMLKEVAITRVALPKYNKTQKIKVVKSPGIFLYKVEDARVNIESSHIFLQDEVIMDRLPHVMINQCNYSTGLVKAHNNILALTCKKNREVLHVKNGIFLGGNGASNYYHLVIEILSKIFYFNKLNIDLKDIKVILNESILVTENYKILLDLLLDGWGMERVFVDKDKIVEVKNLYHLTSPSNIVFNVRQGASFSAEYLYFDKDSIDFIRNKVLNEVEMNNLAPNGLKKIFLARKPGSSRDYNQDEVFLVLNKYGFIAVYLEDFCLLEQAKIFNELDFVIGPSGAAWTNLIYSRSGTKALSWLPSNISDFSAYSTLATFYCCDMRFIRCNPVDDKDVHTAYKLDIDALELNIKEFIL